MKKTYFLILIFTFIPVIGWSQNGYRDFLWGMSIDEVRVKSIQYGSSNRNTAEWNLFYEAVFQERLNNSHFALLHYINNSINWVNNFTPGLFENNWYMGYVSENDMGWFYFSNGRLTSVVIEYVGGIQALNNRYGNGRRVDFPLITPNGSPATIWLENRQRYIVFYNILHSNPRLAYVDAYWMNTIYNNILRDIQERERQSRSLLD